VKSKTIIFGIIGAALCAALALAIALNKRFIGVSASNIERDARARLRINASWEVSKSVSDGISTMIFYSDTLDDHAFAIYLNHAGFSFGCFFSSGGSSGVVAHGIHKFAQDSWGTAVISMNASRVARIELDNGIEVALIQRDFAHQDFLVCS